MACESVNGSLKRGSESIAGLEQKSQKKLHTEDRAEDSTTDSSSEGPPTKGPTPMKAYNNPQFLNSAKSRMIRVMCELEEPKARLEEQGVENIVMFFGSARAKPKKDYELALQQAEHKATANPDDVGARLALQRLQKQAFLIPMFDAVQELAGMLTHWSLKRAAAGKPSYVVGTGGGPGMMTAANKGADLAGGPSVGFGISLPFEDGLNPHVTPDLAFEYHYFFTRKFWMAYKMMGLVIAPGGFGTADELFEILTLMQTGKIKRQLPVILIGKKFWHACINWQAFVDYGMISEHDAKQLVFADTAEEAFPHLVAGIEKLEATQIIANA